MTNSKSNVKTARKIINWIYVFQCGNQEFILWYECTVGRSRIGVFENFAPEQNCQHFADRISKCILLNGNIRTLIQQPLEFVPKYQIHNKSSSVQAKAWWRRAVKLLPEPTMTPFTDVYMHSLPESKVHGANMGPIWGRQDPGGLHLGSMNFAIWAGLKVLYTLIATHYSDAIVSAMTLQVISVSILCSTVYSGADQRKHQSSASLAFVRGINRWPVGPLHKQPVTRKMFSLDDASCYINTYCAWRW